MMVSRLSAEIRQKSYWQLVYVSGYVMAADSAVFLMSSDVWVSVTFLLIMVVLVIVKFQLSTDALLHVTAPDPKNKATQWQLLFKGKSQTIKNRDTQAEAGRKRAGRKREDARQLSRVQFQQ